MQKVDRCVGTFISDLTINRSVFKRFKDVDPELLYKMIYISLLLALIFTLPGITVLLAIYYNTGNLIIAAIVGFSIHFVTIAFSPRISKALTKFFS